MSPCSRRQKTSQPSEVEVAAAQVGTASKTIETRMTRLRFIRSVKVPSSGAAMATPSVEALTVQPKPPNSQGMEERLERQEQRDWSGVERKEEGDKATEENTDNTRHRMQGMPQGGASSGRARQRPRYAPSPRGSRGAADSCSGCGGLPSGFRHGGARLPE